MKLLFCGDVVGRPGRDAIKHHLPKLRREHGLDLVVVSGDNAAGGFGITPAVCKEIFEAGADVITGGDHIWDQKDIIPFISQERCLLRPHNFPPVTPGSGVVLMETAKKQKVLIIHLLGQVFLRDNLDCPFACVENILAEYRLGGNVAAILVDMHAEATSEKNAMGQFLDGRVSAVVGSHTHIPTDDARILPKGTAYQTDTGMCGDYNSIIGFDPAVPLQIFQTKMRKERMNPATGEGTLRGILMETDDKTGLAKSVTVVSLGGVLNQKG